MKLTFEVTEEDITEPGKGTCFVVRCPQIPGFMTDGETIDTALASAVELLRDLKELDGTDRQWLGDYWPAVASRAIPVGGAVTVTKVEAVR